MSPPVAFIIGAGPGVGLSVARFLAKEGYKVAVGSRQPDVEGAKKEGFHPVTLDISKHETVSKAFGEIEEHLGAPASVVVYNAAAHVPSPKGDPFSVPFHELEGVSDAGVSVYAAAQHAVAGFRKLSDGPRTFIVTGNLLPFLPAVEQFFGLGLFKRIAAAVVEQGASSYNKDGFRFYFATEVSESGGSVFPVNGEGHAKAFWRLIKTPEQIKWEQRFFKDGSDRSV